MLITSDFTRINNDTYGNPRYVVHFLHLLTKEERETYNEHRYSWAIKRANSIGGRKFHNKQYGGGIVFQSYSLESTIADIQRVTGV